MMTKRENEGHVLILVSVWIISVLTVLYMVLYTNSYFLRESFVINVLPVSFLSLLVTPIP
jgi:hypothetical protein